MPNLDAQDIEDITREFERSISDERMPTSLTRPEAKTAFQNAVTFLETNALLMNNAFDIGIRGKMTTEEKFRVYMIAMRRIYMRNR